MSDPLLSALAAFFLEPTVGLPLLFTVWALAAWVLWAPPTTETKPSALRRSWFPPDADLASWVYYALADGKYTRVLDAAADRLDTAFQGRYAFPLNHLPLTDWGARRHGVPRARELRRLHRLMSATRIRANDRESRFFVRWGFWRSAEADEADFLSRVDLAIRGAARWTHELEGIR